MIRLSQINITFKKKRVIEDGELTVRRGRITALTGPSGSGKTTLLYCLGMISSQKGHRYEFDGTAVNLKNDREKADFRKSKIGYVFQDNNLVENMTVIDNLVSSFLLTGGKAAEGKVRAKKLLAQIGLAEKEGAYPRQLSGGERQRVAIASALIKDPELIIADEPTSALDTVNTDSVFELLQKIAKEENKMVVIATHDPNIYERSDDVYVIEEKKIRLKEEGEAAPLESSFSKQLRKKTPFRFYPRYIRAGSRKGQLSKRLITLFCALAVSFISLCVDFGENFVTGQEDLMNRIADREIFVVSAIETSDWKQALYRDQDFSFKPDLWEGMKTIDGVDFVVPYAEIQGVDANGKEFFFYAVPYYEDQLMDEKSSAVDESVPKEEGAYLSAAFAKELGLTDLSDTSLSLTLRIPTKIRDVTGPNGLPAEQEITEEVAFDVKVRGIHEGFISNDYTANSNPLGPTVYLPYQTVNALIDEHRAELGEDEKEWLPSACWVVAYRYNEVIEVRNAVRELKWGILTSCRYQDFKTMNASIRETREIMLIISIAILIIVFMMVTMIRVHETERRRFEICVLKANGMTRGEIYKLIFIEAVWEMIKIFLCALIFSSMLALLTNLVLFRQELILINAKLVLALLGISLLSVVAPSVATIIFTNRYEPDKIMRN